MTPLGKLFESSLQAFSERARREIRRDLEDLFIHTFKIDRLSLLTEPERLVEEGSLSSQLERLKAGEPLAYILEEVHFLGCHLRVTPAVLIPRQETELLAAYIVNKLKGKSGTLVDLCTGSGCLGIALKKHLPSFQVILADLSEEALKIARENAIRNSVDLSILQGDFLEPLKGLSIDALVCNPPYVTQEEYLLLDRSVRHFEPKEALVADEEGLAYYRKLQRELPSLMKGGGELFLEIGSTQGEAVSSLFSPPEWERSLLLKDLASHPRFVHAIRS